LLFQKKYISLQKSKNSINLKFKTMENLIKKIQQLKEGLQEESCKKQEPFVKLGSGTAPTLNYRIPQSASFNTYGTQFVKGIKEEWFRGHAKVKPSNNFFETIKDLNEAQLSDLFASAIQTGNSGLIASSKVLKNRTVVVERNRVNTEPSPPMNMAPAMSKAPSEANANSVNAGITSSTTTNTIITDKPIEPIGPGGHPVVPINVDHLANLAKEEKLRPMVVDGLGGQDPTVNFIEEPKTPFPYFTVIEEYTTCSFLGDYGAGRTIKTFSLLPGEKTNITIRTYKESNTQKNTSENVLDSFSQNSASEMEKFIEEETGRSETIASEDSKSSASSKSANVSASVSGSLFKVVKVGVNAGYSSGSSESKTNTNSATRSSNVNSLNKALDKHVSTSNSNRSIDVNTSQTETHTEGEEHLTVREIQNINKSCVLNFVFRQLLQQYTTITYLSNIKIVFCNGYEESLYVVDVDELDKLLEDTVEEEHIKDVKFAILKNYTTVYNYEGEKIKFLELEEQEIGKDLFEAGLIKREEIEKASFWRVNKKNKDTWKTSDADGGSDDGMEIKVNGPILNVTTHTLRTSSLVVDTILGQGEALDSFNMKAQAAVAIGEQLKNVELVQKIEIIQDLNKPELQAENYKKVFGEDCTCCCCERCTSKS
jgi:hypothetical protein